MPYGSGTSKCCNVLLTRSIRISENLLNIFRPAPGPNRQHIAPLGLLPSHEFGVSTPTFETLVTSEDHFFANGPVRGSAEVPESCLYHRSVLQFQVTQELGNLCRRCICRPHALKFTTVIPNRKALLGILSLRSDLDYGYVFHQNQGKLNQVSEMRVVTNQMCGILGPNKPDVCKRG